MADNIRYDVDGYDVITDAIMDLLNQFPALSGEQISFAVLNENRGISMFPMSGAVVAEERADILGRVEQTCQYPFYVVYRAGGLSSSRKSNVKEWLDKLGRWLEGSSIEVSGTTYKLENYPQLSGGRKFTRIERSSVASLTEINNNNTEDWSIAITAQYTNNFMRVKNG